MERRVSARENRHSVRQRLSAWKYKSYTGWRKHDACLPATDITRPTNLTPAPDYSRSTTNAVASLHLRDDVAVVNVKL